MTDINAIQSSSNGTANTAPPIDHSYSRYDSQTGPDQGVSTMGFDDFLDMINPLEHIPVVSSIYRAVTGDTINPVARIAGDALYGGIFGLASAGIAALGAVADEAVASLNGGKSASETVVAALFGSDNDDSKVQLAAQDAPLPEPAATQDATPAQAQSMQLASLQTPARQSPILNMPDLSAATTQMASAQTISTQTAAATPTAIPLPPTNNAPTIATAADTATAGGTQTAATALAGAGTGMPLDRSKQPYGGVMDTAMMQNAMQNQTLALAMSGDKSTMQAQHAIRNNRFSMTGVSSVTAPTPQSAALSLPGDATNTSMFTAPASAAQKISAAQSPAGGAAQALGQALPQSPMPTAMSRAANATGASDLKSIKGLDQYRNSAMRTPVMGASVDVTN